MRGGGCGRAGYPVADFDGSGILSVTVTFSRETTETADYYVATAAGGGSDSNNGMTPETPFLTIGKAQTEASAGDKILVEDGDYLNNTGITLSKSGSAGNLIHYKSRNYLGAKLVGDTKSSGENIGVRISGAYVKVEGFDIHGWRNTNAAGSGGMVISNDNNSVTHNRFRDLGNECIGDSIGRFGIYAEGTSSNTIERNIFFNIGRKRPGEGGCTEPPALHYASLDHPIYVGAGASSWIIRNNIFYDHDNGWCLQLYPTSASSCKVFNNTFVGTNPDKVGRIIIYMSLSDTQFENNIFYQALTAGINWDAGGGSPWTGCTSKNNCSTNLVNDEASPAGVTVSGNITSAPTTGAGGVNFVNPGANDYHLASNSVCRGAGLNLISDVPDDFDGVARPSAAAYDVGAFQFV